MGLFDYLRSEYPLPEGIPQTTVFQTKDAQEQPYMERFRITKEGRLIHERVAYEEVPQNERPYPNGKGLFKMMGAMRSVPLGDVDTNFHGALTFYADAGDWFVLVALFKDGNLIDLRRVE